MQRRLTDDEEQKLRVTWNYLGQIKSPWKEIQKIRQSVCDMLGHNTTDGRPYVEPPLTDEDARTRPWVMVRDTDGEPWKGPHRFAAKCVHEHYPYYVFLEDSVVEFKYCRRATASEIAAAGLEVTE